MGGWMRPDVARLAEALRGLAAHRDEAAGYEEELLAPSRETGDAVAVLTRPLGPARPLGLAFAGAFGRERGFVRNLEARTARRLAAAGFASVRLRDGVASGARGKVLLDERVREVELGAALLGSRAGATRFGAVGAVSGGSVALLAADRLGLEAVAVWEPVVRGSRYLRESVLLARTTASLLGLPVPEGEDDGGSASIRGFDLSAEHRAQLEALDLRTDLERFAGRALVVSVTRAGVAPARLREVVERLEELGSTVALEAVADPLPRPFGEYYFRDAPADGGIARVDTRWELDVRLAELAASWAVETAAVPEAVS